MKSKFIMNYDYFQTDEEAIDAMHKLNGKPIPGTFPVVRFRLNTASREARANMQQEREFSVWVGDLSPEVDDYSLYRVFAAKYSSIKTAKGIFFTNKLFQIKLLKCMSIGNQLDKQITSNSAITSKQIDNE